MADLRELNEQEAGVDEGVEESTALSTAEPTAERQPDREVPPPNWNDSPEFKAWQAKQDREKEEMRRQLMYLNQQVEQQQLAGMDDYEQERHYRMRAEEQANYYRSELDRMAQERQKFESLSETAREWNIPIQELMKAETPMDVPRIIRQYQLQTEQQRAAQAQAAAEAKQQAKQEKQQRNAVNLGSGTPVPTTDWERDYQKMMGHTTGPAIFRHALDGKQG
jgi:hypothetical protein